MVNTAVPVGATRRWPARFGYWPRRPEHGDRAGTLARIYTCVVVASRPAGLFDLAEEGSTVMARLASIAWPLFVDSLYPNAPIIAPRTKRGQDSHLLCDRLYSLIGSVRCRLDRTYCPEQDRPLQSIRQSKLSEDHHGIKGQDQIQR